MIKDTNIRIFKEDQKLLRKVAKKEGRTLKKMFGLIVKFFLEQNVK